MIERNPIPECLSHLAVLRRAGIADGLREAAAWIEDAKTMMLPSSKEYESLIVDLRTYANLAPDVCQGDASACMRQAADLLERLSPTQRWQPTSKPIILPL